MVLLHTVDLIEYTLVIDWLWWTRNFAHLFSRPHATGFLWGTLKGVVYQDGPITSENIDEYAVMNP
jgi:hypothetical protein